jgi:hypothetical protein
MPPMNQAGIMNTKNQILLNEFSLHPFLSTLYSLLLYSLLNSSILYSY